MGVINYNKLIEQLHDTAKLQIGMWHTQNEEIIESAAKVIDDLFERVEKAERERDAVVKDLGEIFNLDELCPLFCEWCKYNERCNGNTPEWKGVQSDR